MRSLGLPRLTETANLVARLRKGEASAIGRAYDLHHEAVRAFAHRLLGDEAAAEDIVHDVFVSLPSLMGRFREESNLRTFLIGVAINHSRHYKRTRSRRSTLLEQAAQEPPDRPQDSPDQAVQSQAILKAIDRAMQTLPLDQRVAFVLCDVEERTAAEAAAITGAPEATMRTRLFHARKKLREALRPEAL